MDERTQGALLLSVGGVALRLGLTDAALSYVRPGLQPLLTVAGALLCLLGAVAVWRAFAAERAATHAAAAGDGLEGERGSEAPAAVAVVAVDDHGGHRHDHGGTGPAVGWLLVLPLLALLLVAPPPLGAFAAARQSNVIPVDTTSVYGPLPAEEDGAVPLTFSSFVYRALYDEQRSLLDARVRLTGFVSDVDAEGGYQLSRFIVGCCAADGRAIDVVLADSEAPPPLDTWLEVEGTWLPRAGIEPGAATVEPPVLEVASRRPISAPAQPYEY